MPVRYVVVGRDVGLLHIDMKVVRELQLVLCLFVTSVDHRINFVKLSVDFGLEVCEVLIYVLHPSRNCLEVVVHSVSDLRAEALQVLLDEVVYNLVALYAPLFFGDHDVVDLVELILHFCQFLLRTERGLLQSRGSRGVLASHY